MLQNILHYIEQPNLPLTAQKVTVLSLRNPDLSFRELTGTLKDFWHLGRTRIYKGPFQTEMMRRTRHRVRIKAC